MGTSRPGPRAPRLLCDVMLGGLARRLRALGYDTGYDHRADDPALLRRAARERRVLVTRDTRLGPAPPGARLVLLRANDTGAQLRELAAALGLEHPPGLLTRCTVCNARLRRARPEEVAERVPDFVRGTQRDFRTCPGCGRVYWPGTHRRGIVDALASALPRLRAADGAPRAAPPVSSAAAPAAPAPAPRAPRPRRRPTRRPPP